MYTAISRGRFHKNPPECRCECTVGGIAQRLRNAGQGFLTAAKAGGGDPHPPTDKVVHRGCPNGHLEAFGKRRAGLANEARKRFDRPRVRGISVDCPQRRCQAIVRKAREPSGMLSAVLREVGAQNVNER